jgi:hypothetical protein
LNIQVQQLQEEIVQLKTGNQELKPNMDKMKLDFQILMKKIPLLENPPQQHLVELVVNI